jgi:ElaB/YqjD/DUF883 family membrane-anchored ribosome-binding protein
LNRNRGNASGVAGKVFAEANMNDAPTEASSAEAAARLKEDLTAVKNDIAHLSQQIADAVNALAAVAQNQGRHGLRRARANVDAVVSNASDRAGAAAGAAQDAASSVADALSDAIQERPVAAVAVAMGLGFLIGVSWRR